MAAVRETWTDERLDDLNQRVSEGFADLRAELRSEIGSVREEIGSVRGELRKEIGLVRKEIGSVREEIGSVRGAIGSVREELARLQRTMIYCFVSLTTMMATGFVAIGTQLH